MVFFKAFPRFSRVLFVNGRLSGHGSRGALFDSSRSKGSENAECEGLAGCGGHAGGVCGSGVVPASAQSSFYQVSRGGPERQASGL